MKKPTRRPHALICSALMAGSLYPAVALQAQASPVTAPAPSPQPATTPPPPPQPASTQPATQPLVVAPPLPDTQPTTLKKVVVSSDLNLVRDQIAPSLGAVSYTVGQDQINAIPGGENATFQQVLARAPGVVLDSFGQEHVRGEHANLTYRINGVLLPEPVSGFGQELDTRLIQSLTLIDGTLPAQFGFHTAGIADVTTKSGATLQSNELSIYGGSHDTFQPSVQFGGSDGRFDYFITSSGSHNDLGIENPDGTHDAIHDYTNQQKFFGYFNFQIDETSKVSLLLNASNADFQIPDTAGLTPQFNLAAPPGIPPTPPTAADSAIVNENQNEQEYYAVLAYQKSIGDLSLQLSGFTRYGSIKFIPDFTQDLLFQGVSGNVFNSFVTNGTQFDSSYILDDHHTLRGGFIADYTNEALNTNTAVFSIDPNTGNQASDVPLNITDNSKNGALEAGVYLQDEWRIVDPLTLNYGLRYDRFDANFDHEGQLSPRANLVWKINDKTTWHIGYARYFVPPPVQNVSISTLNRFQNTTNAPIANGPDGSILDDPPKVERSNYFDMGISRQITKPWSATLDGFYKQAHNLIDLGQFGAPVIESPFNYRTGKVYGAELSSTFKQGGLSVYGNLSWVVTSAHDIDTQQYLIDPDEFAYIQNHDIHLDHESEYAASAGASYSWKHDMIYLDFIYENGLRKGFANDQKEPQYYPVNVGYEHTFTLDKTYGKSVKFRFDILNVLDERYQIRDGSGIGVGAAQFGERRGFFAGLTYNF